ncbi:MAG TPA: sulfotransferase [Caulobacteraceae bacterium]|nr:sulfotransferase [Caulobacteraceae bacterium]
MASETAAPTGTIQTALAHAARLLESRAELAAEQARAVLEAAPGHPQAQLILAAALRRQGRAEEARAILQPLAAQQPRAPAVHLELGVALAELGEDGEALASLRRATALAPDLADAWRALGDVLTLGGSTEEADAAYARGIAASVRDPALAEAAQALVEGKLAQAEHRLREVLRQRPTDVAALRMLAEVGARLGRYDDAQVLLEQALELAPGFDAARSNYATVLLRSGHPADAAAQAGRLLARDPRNPNHRVLEAAALGQAGEFDAAIDRYDRILAEHAGQPKVWMSYGHVLKTVGRLPDSIDAYRRSLDLSPHLGETWWSLANLKTVRFSDDDIARMEAGLARADLSPEDRFHLHFALGKALEDEGRWEASFAHYAAGNAQRRAKVAYDADDNHRRTERARAFFTPALFAERAGQGSTAPDPIFVVGLPRAGSTLIEQILSSHSAVEGTTELPDIIAISRRLGRRRGPSESSAYPEALADLSADDLAALGEEYLERTRPQRRLGRPFFIDKMPNNFAHIGLIHMILPNAKIVDARRHPMGGCFSGFKQHFARGQSFSNDLTDIGRYYRDYVELMRHFDEVLPGRVHRVIYEDMVADPETQVRRLLDYCGLAFEPGVLRFYENDRAVRTPSSEQVRRPIFSEGLDQWRHYEPWLGPLKDALGPALERWRD